MAEPPLNAKVILDQFDSLRDQGELYYNETQPLIIEDGNLLFEFRVVPSFSSKPQLASEGEQVKTAQSARRPPPSDGSDIDHSDPAFFVANIQGASLVTTHKLILNKFCVFRPQYLLLTIDATRKQWTPLDNDDLCAAWHVLEELKDPVPHYVIYNCGRDGGSSRSHKHMQVLQMPDPTSRELHWPNREVSDRLTGALRSADASSPVKMLPLPYLVCYETFDADERPLDVHSLLSAYQKHLDFCAQALADSTEAHTGLVPHNVILTRDWILTIPRTSASTQGIEGHVVNATGMIGLVWLSNDAQLTGWKQTGPVSIMKSLGVPIA